MKDKKYFTDFAEALDYARKNAIPFWGGKFHNGISIYTLSLYPGEIFNPAKIIKDRNLDALVVLWDKEPPNRFKIMDL